MTAAIVLLAWVTAERLGELWLARRNTAALMQQGTVEMAPQHYTVIVTLHALRLMGLWALGWDQPVHTGWLAVFLLLQVLWLWVLATLGPRWTTRIIVLSGQPLVPSGPCRWLTPPNYVVVVGEIAVLPLCLGLPWYALVFFGGQCSGADGSHPGRKCGPRQFAAF